MCGIAGLLDFTGETGALQDAAKRMSRAISHRGPDMEGVWQDPEASVVLTHRRLSIIDLSPEGAQPMVSASGRFVVSYNGEIYNYRTIQAELAELGVTFKGRSDTEIMLAAFERWGVNAALQRLNGMFATALWDRRERKLHLIRDRLGKKPVYAGWAGKQLLFASELKAFHANRNFEAVIDRQVLASYMRCGFVPAPYAIYRRVWQVLPGCRLTIDLDKTKPGDDLSLRMEPYWHLPRVVEDARAHPILAGDDEVVEEFEGILRQCVQDRMMSDVPLGAFLSGGIDSSTIVALMQQVSGQPVKTYSIGFEEQGYDEAKYAARVAKHLGTDHHEHYLSAKESMDVIPALPDIYDEPFADASQIPTYLVSRFARKDVTVALSGDGGDEMLGGYLRHFLVPELWSRVGWMPRPLRARLGAAIRRWPQERWDSMMPSYPQFGRRLYKFSELMGAKGRGDVYAAQVEQWRGPVLAQNGTPLLMPLEAPEWQPKGLNFAEQMIYYDMLSYLPNDLMVKADRASMAVALEVRAPLLDRRVAEFAWRLPLRFKTRRGRQPSGKWLLRRVLERHVPAELFARPKQGFSVPVEQWLSGPLRGWAEDLLDHRRMAEAGWLDADTVAATWRAYLNGETQNAGRLWTVLMFQAWLARWHGEKSSSIAA